MLGSQLNMTVATDVIISLHYTILYEKKRSLLCQEDHLILVKAKMRKEEGLLSLMFVSPLPNNL